MRASKPQQKIIKFLDILFILHLEHEFNCSIAAIRHMVSSQSDVCSSVARTVTAAPDMEKPTRLSCAEHPRFH